ncbi:MAG TPA: STAS domain-containing protein [Candidatus Baltobacteraceae bacterium]
MGARITLRGDYDIWRRDELRAELNTVELTDDVTIDLSQTTLMDAGSAALLILLHRRLHDKNPDARVILENAPPIVQRILWLCGASHLFVFTAKG